MLTKLFALVMLVALATARNNALATNGLITNGQFADEHITTHGSDVYFAFMAVMGLFALTVLIWGHLKSPRDRLFYYITALINFIAMIAYFTMGSNLGWTAIGVEFHRNRSVVNGLSREIFYVRYIDWFLTTPLLLLDLMLTVRVPWPTIVFTIIMDWIMIVCGLVGALVRSRYKWAYWAFGCAAMFYIFYQIWFEGLRRARSLHTSRHLANRETGVSTISNSYTMLAGLLTFVWMLYPICWALCEGGNVISSDSEAVFYGILDFLAKPVFSFLLLWRHSNINNDALGLGMRGYDDLPGTSVHDHEKLLSEGTIPQNNFTSKTATPVTGTAAYEGDQYGNRHPVGV